MANTEANTEKTNLSTSETTQTSDSKPAELDTEYKWLIRDCEVYKDEYKECTSFRGRFHQYFIYGEPQDCNQWKKDYDNCCKWQEDKEVKAAETLIESEKKRRLERLRGHYNNDIWKKRETPPADWDKPLPEWMVKREENTYLAQKANEIREGTEENDNDKFCVIM